MPIQAIAKRQMPAQSVKIVREVNVRQFGLCAVALFLVAGAAAAEDRPATVDENAMIQNYRTVINHAAEAIGATTGWAERTQNRQDIPDDVTISATTEGPFYFYGDITRMYEGAPSSTGPSKSEQIEALMAKRQKATSAAEKQNLMAQIQALAMAPVDEDRVSDLLITTAHNQPYVALDSDNPQPVEAPAGVARVWQVNATFTVKTNTAYILEFGDPAAFQRSDPDQNTQYRFAHDDGSAHIENFEIRIEGPPAVVDNLLKSYDWTKARAALTE